MTALATGSPPGRAGAWTRRDLLALRGTRADELRVILKLAAHHAAHDGPAPHPRLKGRVVANLFFEDSTRTRLSFSIAATRLGATPVDLLAAGSSVNKGETLLDTARTVDAMGVGALIIRHNAAGAPARVAAHVSVPVLNAGDGRHEHPTQGLLDALTVAQAHGREDTFDFTGLRIAVVGDVLNSRVARSDAAAFTALGAEVVLAGPPALAPKSIGGALGCAVSHNMDDAIARADAVQMLRIQFERLGQSGAVASVREYAAAWQLTPARAARMQRAAVVMHPGPMNRGVEIHPDVADGERSVILRQVANGVPVRMAALSLCADANG